MCVRHECLCERQGDVVNPHHVVLCCCRGKMGAHMISTAMEVDLVVLVAVSWMGW